MNVECEVEEVELENEEGYEQSGVRVTCGRCKHTAEAFGTGLASVRRCAVQLKVSCPKKERNFYVVESP